MRVGYPGRVIPPTINLEHPGEECDLDYTPNVAREKKVRVALNNSFGFGGHNATLVAAAFEEGRALLRAHCNVANRFDYSPAQSLFTITKRA